MEDISPLMQWTEQAGGQCLQWNLWGKYCSIRRVIVGRPSLMHDRRRGILLVPPMTARDFTLPYTWWGGAAGYVSLCTSWRVAADVCIFVYQRGSSHLPNSYTHRHPENRKGEKLYHPFAILGWSCSVYKRHCNSAYENIQLCQVVFVAQLNSLKGSWVKYFMR